MQLNVRRKRRGSKGEINAFILNYSRDFCRLDLENKLVSHTAPGMPVVSYAASVWLVTLIATTQTSVIGS